MISALLGLDNEVSTTDESTSQSMFDFASDARTCTCRTHVQSATIPGTAAQPFRVISWNGNIGRLVAELVRAKTWQLQRRPLVNLEKFIRVEYYVCKSRDAELAANEALLQLWQKLLHILQRWWGLKPTKTEEEAADLVSYDEAQAQNDHTDPKLPNLSDGPTSRIIGLTQGRVALILELLDVLMNRHEFDLIHLKAAEEKAATVNAQAQAVIGMIKANARPSPPTPPSEDNADSTVKTAFNPRYVYSHPTYMTPSDLLPILRRYQKLLQETCVSILTVVKQAQHEQEQLSGAGAEMRSVPSRNRHSSLSQSISLNSLSNSRPPRPSVTPVPETRLSQLAASLVSEPYFGWFTARILSMAFFRLPLLTGGILDALLENYSSLLLSSKPMSEIHAMFLIDQMATEEQYIQDIKMNRSHSQFAWKAKLNDSIDKFMHRLQKFDLKQQQTEQSAHDQHFHPRVPTPRNGASSRRNASQVYAADDSLPSPQTPSLLSSPSMSLNSPSASSSSNSNSAVLHHHASTSPLPEPELMPTISQSVEFTTSNPSFFEWSHHEILSMAHYAEDLQLLSYKKGAARINADSAVSENDSSTTPPLYSALRSLLSDSTLFLTFMSAWFGHVHRLVQPVAIKHKVKITGEDGTEHEVDKSTHAVCFSLIPGYLLFTQVWLKRVNALTPLGLLPPSEDEDEDSKLAPVSVTNQFDSSTNLFLKRGARARLESIADTRELLLQTPCLAPRFLSFQVELLLRNTNVFARGQVERCLSTLQRWFDHSLHELENHSPAEGSPHAKKWKDLQKRLALNPPSLVAPLPPAVAPSSFCTETIVNSIKALLNTEHYQILLKTLTFLFANLGRFFYDHEVAEWKWESVLGLHKQQSTSVSHSHAGLSGDRQPINYRTQIIMNLVLDPTIFLKCFLHWCPEVRRVFHCILLFRCMRRPQAPEMIPCAPQIESSVSSAVAKIHPEIVKPHPVHQQQQHQLLSEGANQMEVEKFDVPALTHTPTIPLSPSNGVPSTTASGDSPSSDSSLSTKSLHRSTSFPSPGPEMDAVKDAHPLSSSLPHRSYPARMRPSATLTTDDESDKHGPKPELSTCVLLYSVLSPSEMETEKSVASKLQSYLESIQTVYVDTPAKNLALNSANSSKLIIPMSPSRKVDKLDVIIASKSSQNQVSKTAKETQEEAANLAAMAAEKRSSLASPTISSDEVLASSPLSRHSAAALAVTSLAAMDEAAAGSPGPASVELAAAAVGFPSASLPFYPHLEVYAAEACEEFKTHTAAFRRLQRHVVDLDSKTSQADHYAYSMIVPLFYYNIPTASSIE